MAMVLVACGGGDEPAAEAPSEPAAPEAPAEQPEPEPAEDVTYEGERIRLVVGASPGGGYDTYAQFMARHLGNFIPGNPAVDVVHQQGAGGMVAYNNTWEREPTDGTVITFSIGSALVNGLLGLEEAVYDSLQFQFIGAPISEHETCMVRADLGITSLGDLEGRDEPLRFGGIAPGVPSDVTAEVIGMVTDFNVELFSGYDGTSEMHLALLQGEVDANCLGWESIAARHADELADGTVELFVQAGTEPHPDLPDVPLLRDFVDSGDSEAIALIEATVEVPGKISRPLLVHPDVPAERVAVLRQAFQEMITDADFLAEAAEIGLAIDPLDGEELDEAIRTLGAALEQVGDVARTLYFGGE